MKRDRQDMYKHIIEVCSPNYSWNGRAISITYSECVFVTLGIQPATHVHHIVICGLSGSTVFFHIILYMSWLSKKSYWA